MMYGHNSNQRKELNYMLILYDHDNLRARSVGRMEFDSNKKHLIIFSKLDVCLKIIPFMVGHINGKILIHDQTNIVS